MTHEMAAKYGKEIARWGDCPPSVGVWVRDGETEEWDLTHNPIISSHNQIIVNDEHAKFRMFIYDEFGRLAFEEIEEAGMPIGGIDRERRWMALFLAQKIGVKIECWDGTVWREDEITMQNIMTDDPFEWRIEDRIKDAK